MAGGGVVVFITVVVMVYMGKVAVRPIAVLEGVAVYSRRSLNDVLE